LFVQKQQGLHLLEFTKCANILFVSIVYFTPNVNTKGWRHDSGATPTHTTYT